jgi:hypothetical protein
MSCRADSRDLVGSKPPQAGQNRWYSQYLRFDFILVGGSEKDLRFYRRSIA